MDTNAGDDSFEPFGQRGVLTYAWPTFVVLCALGFCTCLIMSNRSASIWDTVSSSSGSGQIRISSVIGRVVIDSVPSNGMDASSSTWNFDSRPFGVVQDSWAPSWKKTLGVEWGYEASPRQFGAPTMNYWRMRIRWRTLAILYALPVGIELLRRLRRRMAGGESQLDVVAPTPQDASIN